MVIDVITEWNIFGYDICAVCALGILRCTFFYVLLTTKILQVENDLDNCGTDASLIKKS